MKLDALMAQNAYAAAARQAVSSTPANAAPAPAQASDFGAILKDAAAQTQATLAKTDATASAVTAGEANLVDVVTAIAEAELSLDAALAVRNRIIEAYQEIMRMPI